MGFLISLKNKKIDFFKKENIFYLILIFIIFLLDRYSKFKIINDFNSNSFFLNDYINLDLIWNTGIGFGLFSTDASIVYNSITFLVGLIILILFFIAFRSKNLDKFIYSIIIGGAIGNFYDRLIYKAVPDFIDLHYNNFHWFTFNVADIFITLGIVIFLFKELLYNK